MSLTYGFYNSVNHDRRYDAVQLSSIFDGVIIDGVFGTIGNHLHVAPNTGLSIKIQSGRAWFNHTWTYNDADYPLSIDDAEVALYRKDAVVLEINSNTNVRQNSFKVIKGTPSPLSSPPAPEMVHTLTVNQYPLAYITVDPLVTEITADKIHNNLGESVLPIVEGAVNTVDISQLVAQWAAQFQAWMTAKEGDFSSWSTEQRAEFEEWFAQIRVELTENVAALLLEKCRLLKELRHIILRANNWVQNGEFFVQTVEYDENNISLNYDVADHPVIVDGLDENTLMTKAQLAAYYKNLGIITSGQNEMTQFGGFTFYVTKLPTADVRVGLKGV